MADTKYEAITAWNRRATTILPEHDHIVDDGVRPLPEAGHYECSKCGKNWGDGIGLFVNTKISSNALDDKTKTWHCIKKLDGCSQGVVKWIPAPKAEPRKEPKGNEVCKHGHWARQCEVCELEAENAGLKAELAKYKEMESRVRGQMSDTFYSSKDKAYCLAPLTHPDKETV